MGDDRERELAEENERLRARVAELEGELVGPDLRRLAEYLPDNLMVLDRDERIRFINWTAEGLTVDQVIGTRPYQYVPPDNRESLRACYRRVLETGEPDRVESMYVAPDGSISKWETRASPVMRDGEVDGVVTINTNITEREAAAADRDQFFRLSPDLLCIATVSGYFRRVNPAFTRTLGWSQAELTAEPYWDIVHPDDHEATRRVVDQLGAGDDVIDFVNRYRCADGGYRTLQWRASAVPEEGVIFAVGRDITDQRELEARLRQSQKMEAVGQLAAGIAHDFNNLLLALRLNTDLARRRTDEPRVLAHLDESEAVIDRAIDLTRQLLTFSRRQPLHVKPVDLNECAERLVKMLRRTIPESIEITLDTGPVESAIDADPGQIEQVLLNLCLNARDAIEGTGRIELAVGVADPHVYVSVADDGAGMTPEVCDRVFEPFFTTKAPGSGTGLGLAVVYAITDRYGGFVKVESQPGLGSKFTVFFPAGAEAGSDRAAAAAAPDAASTGETILVAEDAPALRRAVVTILESAGYQVLTASDGAVAVQRVCAEGGRIALALLDVVMPNMSGPQAAEAIREAQPDIAILFTTGYSDSDALASVSEDDILRKPYNPGDLLHRVRRALNGKAT